MRAVFMLDNSKRVGDNALVGFVTVECETPDSGEALLLANNDLQPTEVLHVGEEVDE